MYKLNKYFINKNDLKLHNSEINKLLLVHFFGLNVHIFY